MMTGSKKPKQVSQSVWNLQNLPEWVYYQQTEMGPYLRSKKKESTY